MGKNLADLQSNISISATNAVTGDIEWCSGYTQFSTDIGEQAGWYLALQVTPDIEDATVTAAYNGTIRTLSNNIYIIRLADGEDTITFTAEKEGYTTGRLTLDLSGLNKETITNYCYVTSLTNGVTVTPLQFGESKTLSGVVPYDTTTSSNHFTLKYRTFIPIPNGSGIFVSHFGTELGSSTFSTVTPQEGEPYSEATVDITITQDILDSQSPGLSTLIIPDTGEVLDRFYCSLGVENLTLEAAPVDPSEAPWWELSGITYNNVTYSASDFSTGGTITRDTTGYFNSQIHLEGATIKYLELDPSAEENYYLAFTSVAGTTIENRGTQKEVLQAYLKDSLNSVPSPYLIPQTFLVKVGRNQSIQGGISVTTSTVAYISQEIKLINCTWEADPRPTQSEQIEFLTSGKYNGTSISDYFSTTGTGLDSIATYLNNNGYYGFIRITNYESGTTDNLSTYIDYTDVTSNITDVQLGANDKVYMYDISTLNQSVASIKFLRTGYQPKLISFLDQAKQKIAPYANGLTARNIGVSPLSSTVKAAGFENYCDLTFTPIDPATATVVNDEVNVSVNGTIKSKSGTSALGASLTDYQPMYKNWPNSYGAFDKRNDMYMDANKYFFIIEVDNGLALLNNFNDWQCKGFTSTQTTFTQLKAPEVLNTTTKKTLWAIPIESGMTSVSIKCIPTSQTTPMTEVTYNFDLTNVTYGTF